MPHSRILVVDDEPETVKYVGSNLRTCGYDVLVARDGTEALKLIQDHVLHLIILDIGMPGPDGFEVCRAVRRWSDVPIIVLSARGQERDRVRALDLGADDYLTKPFGVDELLARVRSVLRRSAKLDMVVRPPLVVGELRIDYTQRAVARGGRSVALTPTEYRLLEQLMLHAGRVLTHGSLLANVWGPEYHAEVDYLWAYIKRLRQKLERDPRQPRYIQTVPGVGYRFSLEEAVSDG